MVIVFLAEGFEEAEAVTPIDILRRSGATVQIVGIGGKAITGAHGITIEADVTDEEFVMSKRAELVFLPGGKGTANLNLSPVVHSTLAQAKKLGIFISAICAASMVLQENGILDGQKATIYPTFKDKLPADVYSEEAICDSGRIITARSVGVVLEFSLLLVEKLAGFEKAKTIRNSLYI